MAAHSGIIKDLNNDDFYPLTYADVVYLQDNSTVQTAISNLQNANLISGNDSGVITTTLLANDSVTTAKLDYSQLGNDGDWVLLDSNYISSDVTSTNPVPVYIPAEFQGANCEYKLYIGLEGKTAGLYPRLQVQTAGGWQSNNINFCYTKDEGGATLRYSASEVTAFSWEWHMVNAYESCCAEVFVSRAGSGNFWNAWCRAGGQSSGGASTFSGGARTQFADTLTGFGITSGSAMVFSAGTHLTLFGRKYNKTGGRV